MNQLRLTQKVRKAAALHAGDLHEVHEHGVGLGSWTVNLFYQDRKKVLLFLNEKTLYSFVLTGVRKEHFNVLREKFCLGLLQLLEIDGFGARETDYLMQGLDQITYSKTNSPKVLGNMNDLVFQYKECIRSDGGLGNANVGRIIHTLNHRMPQKNIGWRFSIEAVAEIAKNA